MSSGIYKLTFSDGSIYIGKSADINKRCIQHVKALRNGTHTKNIQEVYDRCGVPKYETLFECHPDHINILENYFINLYWNYDKVLNTTRPSDLTPSEKRVFVEFPAELWEMSTFEHIVRWEEISERLKTLMAKSAKSADVKYLEKLENDLKSAEEEIQRLGSRSILARIFNKY